MWNLESIRTTVAAIAISLTASQALAIPVPISSEGVTFPGGTYVSGSIQTVEGKTYAAIGSRTAEGLEYLVYRELEQPNGLNAQWVGLSFLSVPGGWIETCYYGNFTEDDNLIITHGKNAKLVHRDKVKRYEPSMFKADIALDGRYIYQNSNYLNVETCAAGIVSETAVSQSNATNESITGENGITINPAAVITKSEPNELGYTNDIAYYTLDGKRWFEYHLFNWSGGSDFSCIAGTFDENGDMNVRYEQYISQNIEQSVAYDTYADGEKVFKAEEFYDNGQAITKLHVSDISECGQYFTGFLGVD